MRNRQAAIAFIFVTVMLDMLALGLIAPVLPKLVLSFLNNDMTRAANWNGIFLTVFAAMQFFFSPVIGVLSDRIGRRPVLLLSSLGLGLDYVVMALAPTIGWLFLGRIISGITASSIPTAMAYIADVTPREKRAGAFGLIGAALASGSPSAQSSADWSATLTRAWHSGSPPLSASRTGSTGFSSSRNLYPKINAKNFPGAGPIRSAPSFCCAPIRTCGNWRRFSFSPTSRTKFSRSGHSTRSIALPGIRGALVIHFSLSVCARQ